MIQTRTFMILLTIALVMTPEISALDWMDESFQAESWQTGPAPLGHNDESVVTEITPGRPTYYFRTLFDLPSPDDLLLDTLWVRVFTTHGIIIYAHGMDSGRSASLPQGALDYTETAAFPSNTPQDFDISWMLTDCELGLTDSLRSIALELHRIDGDFNCLSFDAAVMGSRGSQEYTLMPPGSLWHYYPLTDRPIDNPPEKIGLIRKPLAGIPEICRPNDSLSITCVPQPDMDRWRFYLINARHVMDLGVPKTITESPMGSILELMLPQNCVPGTYDILAAGPVDYAEKASHSVTILPPGDDLSAVHITDSHIPFRGDYARHNYEDLINTISSINTMGPDIVFHTGDGYNEGNGKSQAELFAASLQLFDMGILYISGNHELGEWCGDGTSRKYYWDNFGWPELNPQHPDHWGIRTRDFVLDIGPISIVGLETWVNYTNYWLNHYGRVSLLPQQINWLKDTTQSRQDQYLICLYHHDFGEQLHYELTDNGFDLGLSGHTHSEDQELAGETLLLKTPATYNQSQPIRWLRIEDGQLKQYPLLSRYPLTRRLDFDPQLGHYSVELTIRNREYALLEGLKSWIAMPPDSEYTTEGPGLLGKWSTSTCQLIGFEYDLQGLQEQVFSIKPSYPLTNISAWLDPSTLFCLAGESVGVHARISSREVSQTIRLFIALKVENEYFFWPDWTEDIRYFDMHIATGRNNDIEILNFKWPNLPVMGENFDLLIVAFNPYTGEAITPLYNTTLYY